LKHQHKNSEFHLSAEELRRLIEAAPTLRDRVMVQLLAFTGMRRAEVSTLKVEDLDLPRRRLLVRNGKGGKQRIVFLSEEVSQTLAMYTGDLKGSHIFPGRDGGPMTLRNVNHIIRKVGRLAGVENPNPRHTDVTPHLLRHSFARNWKRAGGSMESLQKILGHASLRTTMDVYGTEGLQDTESNYRTIEDLLVSARLPRNSKV
jgi:integrase/recombinase XerD